MPSNSRVHAAFDRSKEHLPHTQKQDELGSPPLALLARQARTNPRSLSHPDLFRLQRSIGNHAVNRLLNQPTPVQDHTLESLRSEHSNQKQHMQRTWEKNDYQFDEQLLIDAIVSALEFNDGDHIALNGSFDQLPFENDDYASKPIHTIADGTYIRAIALDLAKLIFDHNTWLNITSKHVSKGEKFIQESSLKDVKRKYTGDSGARVWVLKNGTNGQVYKLRSVSIEILKMLIKIDQAGQLSFDISALHWMPYHT